MTISINETYAGGEHEKITVAATAIGITSALCIEHEENALCE